MEDLRTNARYTEVKNGRIDTVTIKKGKSTTRWVHIVQETSVQQKETKTV